MRSTPDAVGSEGWSAELTFPCRDSGTDCAAPSSALEDPLKRMRLLRGVSIRSCDSLRRRMAHPSMTQLGAQGKRCSDRLGGFLQLGKLLRPGFVIVTMEGRFCERTNSVVPSDLLRLFCRGRLAQVAARLDPLDFLHICSVRVRVRRQENSRVFLVGRQLFLKREVPRMGTALQSLARRVVSRGATSKASARPANSPTALD